MTPAQHPFNWYVAKLRPFAEHALQNWMPEPNKAGDIMVWYSPVQITPGLMKVLVVAQLKGYGIRILTPELAATLLIHVGDAKPLDASSLNLLTQHVEL